MGIKTVKFEGGPLDGLTVENFFIMDGAPLFVVGPREKGADLAHCELCLRKYSHTLMSMEEWKKLEPHYKENYPGDPFFYWVDTSRPDTFITSHMMMEKWKKQANTRE